MMIKNRLWRTLTGCLAALGLAAGLIIGAAGPASAQDPAAFFETPKAPAQAGDREFGVPASVAMAQAALEDHLDDAEVQLLPVRRVIRRYV